MHLRLDRTFFSDTKTISKLYVDGLFYCYVLEDKVRKEKIAKITAIPQGTYKVNVSYSPKFKQLMPRLLDVPNFEGILIHPGTNEDNTWGCLLVGELDTKNDTLTNSRPIYNKLYLALKQAQDKGEEIDIKIHDVRPMILGLLVLSAAVIITIVLIFK
jgi:hypothetical protein